MVYATEEDRQAARKKSKANYYLVKGEQVLSEVAFVPAERFRAGLGDDAEDGLYTAGACYNMRVYGTKTNELPNLGTIQWYAQELDRLNDEIEELKNGQTRKGGSCNGS